MTCMWQVMTKFPAEVVAAQAELLQLPLVMRLVNDPMPKVWFEAVS